MNSRAQAAKVLERIVRDHCSIKVALALNEIPNSGDSRDKAFIQELVYGVCRWYFGLTHELSKLLTKPLKQKDCDLQCLLLVGLYQLIHLDTPHHAVVKETVAATNGLRKTWARGLVNACLRQAIRNNTGAPGQFESTNEQNQPDWLVNLLMQDWPDSYPQILAAYNQRPPLCLRVNLRQTSRERYLDLLAEQGINARKAEFSPSGVYLERAMPASAIPGFDSGSVSIQDEAAQLAGHLVSPLPGERILDACAAPGGKACHLLEIGGDDLDITVLDSDPQRLELIRHNFTRLSFPSEPVCGDATNPHEWWDGKVFDKILVDAPCSATGILRRQPDIKIHRRESDIDKLASLQQSILTNLWPLLKPAGVLIYATCSVLKVENEKLITSFVDNHDDCRVDELIVDWGRGGDSGRHILPGESDMDGFYYCRLIKS
ncbi:MAG: 16S rRNA (cytosine(967)-C(5))-methyltransferase RsmB [Gammaproteobacteria bacterium]